MVIIDFFVKKNEIVFYTVIAYRKEIGVVDIRALERFVKKYKVSRLYLLSSKELTDGTKRYLKDLRSDIEVKSVVSSSFSQEIKKLKNSKDNGLVKVINLDEFGERPMQNDSC